MKYAVIRTGGKQYRVFEGETITVEHLPQEKGEVVIFDDVLMYTNDGVAKVGTPKVSEVVVKGIVEDEARGEKILVRKYKAKVRYRKMHGHKQLLSRVRIDQIGEGEKKPKAETPKQARKQASA